MNLSPDLHQSEVTIATHSMREPHTVVQHFETMVDGREYYDPNVYLQQHYHKSGSRSSEASSAYSGGSDTVQVSHHLSLR